MGPYYFWMSGMWILFPIVMVVAMIVVIYLIFGRRNGGPMCHDSDRRYHYDKHKDSESPLDILNKRYAKGEITKEDYEKMKRDISNAMAK